MKKEKKEEIKCNFFKRVFAHILAIKITDFFDNLWQVNKVRDIFSPTF